LLGVYFAYRFFVKQNETIK